MSPIVERYKRSKDDSVSVSGSLADDVRNYARERPVRSTRNEDAKYKLVGHLERPTRKSTGKSMKRLTPRRKQEISEFLRNVLKNPAQYGATESNGGVIDRKMMMDQLLNKLRMLKGGRRSGTQISGSDLRRWLQNKSLISLITPLMRGQDLQSMAGSVGDFSQMSRTAMSGSQDSSSSSRMDVEMQSSGASVIMPTKASLTGGSQMYNGTLDPPGTSAGTLRLTGSVNAEMEDVSTTQNSSRGPRQSSKSAAVVGSTQGEIGLSGAGAEGAKNQLAKNLFKRPQEVFQKGGVSYNSLRTNEAVQDVGTTYGSPMAYGSVKTGGGASNHPSMTGEAVKNGGIPYHPPRANGSDQTGGGLSNHPSRTVESEGPLDLSSMTGDAVKNGRTPYHPPMACGSFQTGEGTHSSMTGEAIQNGRFPYQPPMADEAMQAGTTPGGTQKGNQTDENGSMSQQEEEEKLQPETRGEQQELPGVRQPSESEMALFCRGVKDDLRSIYSRYEAAVAAGYYHDTFDMFLYLLKGFAHFTWNYMDTREQ